MTRREPRTPLAVLGQGALAPTGPVRLPCGARSGDVTAHEAVLWAKGDGPGRLSARLTTGAHVGHVLRGPLVDETTDFTGRLELTGLTPGSAYDAAVWFDGIDGLRGEVGHLHFRTAALSRRSTSLAWLGPRTADGPPAYRAVHRSNPDLVVDLGPAVDPTGDPVAQRLEDFRARHRALAEDPDLRALREDTPSVCLWDDHETHRGWLPGAILADERYEERRADVLAARARRAWQEYQPIRSEDVRQRGDDGYARDRIYRHVPRGALLDLYCLDLRGAGADAALPLLGPEQAEWLVREVSRSKAVWKVLAADQAPNPDDPELEQVRRGMHDHGVTGVVWVHPGGGGVTCSGDGVDLDPGDSGSWGLLSVAADGRLTVTLH